MRSSKLGNFTLHDNASISLLKKIKGRPFSEYEAYGSFAKDFSCGKKGSISGYSKQWGWSRNKVRRFTQNLLSEKGQLPDRNRTGTGHPIHLIFREDSAQKDRNRTGTGQEPDTTIRIDKSKSKDKKNTKKKYGTFENVLLTEEENQKVFDRFNGSAEEKINNLSEYVESTGKKYKSHYATILAWARREEKKPLRGQPRATTVHQEGIVQRNALAQQILQVRENGNNERTSVNDNGLIEHKVS